MGTTPRNFLLYIVHITEIKNFEQHRNFLSDIHRNRTGTKLYQGATEYKVSLIYAHLCLRYSFYKMLETYIQTDRSIDRHFLKMVKLCTGHPKTCKSLEIGCRKPSRNQCFLHMHVEESKNLKQNKGFFSTSM